MPAEKEKERERKEAASVQEVKFGKVPQDLAMARKVNYSTLLYLYCIKLTANSSIEPPHHPQPLILDFY